MLVKFILILSCIGAAWSFIQIPLLEDLADDDFTLEWSDVYSVRVVKMSLTSGLVENIKVWYDLDSMKSRWDYNNGSVKIIISASGDYGSGAKYEIHPETTAYETNEIICYNKTNIEGISITEIDNILPSTEDFDEVDVDVIDGIETEKFYSKTSGRSYDTRQILWAKQDLERKIWIPVRYETFEYNPWLGSLSEHVYWEFHDFTTTVDHKVFSTSKYDCVPSDDDDVATKLHFINPGNDAHVNYTFNAFKNKYNKIYAHQDEHEMRKSIFKKNMKLITATNRQNLGYKLTINKFSDLTETEMKKYKGLRRRPDGNVGSTPFPYTKDDIADTVESLPKEFDLRLLGVIPPIRNQESCGSCWTFGTTAAVEGALARSNGGRVLHLSEQAIIDCAWEFRGSGCDGGQDIAAYKWIMKYGLPTEEEYGPYLNQDGYCLISNMTETYKIRGFTDVTPFSIEALKVAIVNHGPLSVSIEASDAFSYYSSGIFDDPSCSSTELDHEVSLVGYGEKNGDTFWILRNSWGPDWGDGGYMYISTRGNNCGVATEPTYVTI